MNVWKGFGKNRMLTFLLGENVVVRSFEETVADAKVFAREYRRRGVGREDIVIIILGHRAELVAAFLGALWIGALPSFMPGPSEKQDLNCYWESHIKLFEFLGAELLVTDHTANTQGIAQLKKLAMPIWNIDESSSPTNCGPDEQERELDVARVSCDPDAIAFLQHSSGTTALKKSVALTHRQVVAQITAYQKAIGMQVGETIVSWLPLYHDMGLIACLILPMLCGAHVVMMSPFAWVRKPSILLDFIELYHGDYCWMPNFAFNLLAITKPAHKSWRLEHVKAFINCSEPCKADTFRRFLDSLAASGVGPNQLQVCYAMAETVFAVTQTKLCEPVVPLTVKAPQYVDRRGEVCCSSDSALSFLPAGAPIDGLRVQIFDDNRAPVTAEGIIGEIGVSGEPLFDGYYGRHEETQRRRIGGWHLTGDLGFFQKGNLYVTGRKNDLIIVRGKKFHAFDIEHVVSRVAGIKPGRSVAFSLDNEENGTEDCVVVAETESSVAAESRQRLRAAVRKAVYDGLGLLLSDVHLAPARWIIKTTSGKVSRHLNAEKYRLARFDHV